MTNQTLTQKVLFDADENQEKPKKKSLFKEIVKSFSIPIVMLGLVGGGIGYINYTNSQAEYQRIQGQTQRENSRQELILRIAQYKENEPNFIKQFLADLNAANGGNINLNNLAPSEIDFIKQYRKDHPEYERPQTWDGN